MEQEQTAPTFVPNHPKDAYETTPTMVPDQEVNSRIPKSRRQYYDHLSEAAIYIIEQQVRVKTASILRVAKDLDRQALTLEASDCPDLEKAFINAAQKHPDKLPQLFAYTLSHPGVSYEDQARWVNRQVRLYTNGQQGPHESQILDAC